MLCKKVLLFCFLIPILNGYDIQNQIAEADRVLESAEKEKNQLDVLLKQFDVIIQSKDVEDNLIPLLRVSLKIEESVLHLRWSQVHATKLSSTIKSDTEQSFKSKKISQTEFIMRMEKVKALDFLSKFSLKYVINKLEKVDDILKKIEKNHIQKIA